jgi:hypothetical protein
MKTTNATALVAILAAGSLMLACDKGISWALERCN